MRPLSPRRAITGHRGTRQPWQHAFSDIDAIAIYMATNICHIRCANITSSKGWMLFLGKTNYVKGADDKSGQLNTRQKLPMAEIYVYC